MSAAKRLASAALVLVLAGTSTAGERISGRLDASRPFLVKIHADWCGTCQRMAPAFQELEKRVGDGARIVVLDMTDQASARNAYFEAKRLELLEFFQEHKKKTGTVGVLRGDDREVVAVLRGELDPAVYEAALDEARRAP